MDKLLFVPRVLQKLADPVFLARFAAWFLRGLAAILVLYAAVGLIVAWKEIADFEAEAIVGGIFFLVALVATAYTAAHALLIRAAEAGRLTSRDCPGSVLGSLLLRLAGELAASIGIFLGLGSGILVWFAGRRAGAVLEEMPKFLSFMDAGKGNFAAGAMIIVKGAIGGGFALLAGYVLAELFLACARRTQAGQ